jgi:hypothetical protein
MPIMHVQMANVWQEGYVGDGDAAVPSWSVCARPHPQCAPCVRCSHSTALPCSRRYTSEMVEHLPQCQTLKYGNPSLVSPALPGLPGLLGFQGFLKPMHARASSCLLSRGQLIQPAPHARS